MDIRDGEQTDTVPDATDIPEPAPWGINPATNKPYTKSPEERAAIGRKLTEARAAAAARRGDPAAVAPPAGEDLPPVDRSAPDREPGRGRRRRAKPESKPDKEEIPAFRAGPIAKGMNRLYAKAGKIVRVVHPLLGEGIISCTRKESDDDVTVGEAWEELARVNPRWRARLLKLVSGGAWGQVVAAHGPMLLAIVMLDPIRRRLPFPDVVDALLGADETPGPAAADGWSAADMEQAMAMASQMMGPMLAQRMGAMPVRPPEAEAA